MSADSPGPLGRLSGLLAVGAALLGATTVLVGARGVSTWAFVGIGTVAGFVLVTVGLWESSRRLLTGGCVLLGGVALIGGAGGAPFVVVLGGAIAGVFAWDVGRHAISIHEEVGTNSETRSLEIEHATFVAGLLLGGGAVAYVLYALVLRELSEFAAVAVVGMVLLAVSLVSNREVRLSHVVGVVMLLLISLGLMTTAATIPEHPTPTPTPTPAGLRITDVGVIESQTMTQMDEGGGPSNKGGTGNDLVGLLFIGVTVILLGILATRRLGSFEFIGSSDTESSRETEKSLAETAGDVADRIESREIESDADALENEVYRAWDEMRRHLDIESETITPGEFAEAAVDAGFDEDAVAELTAVFSAVRYGTSKPTDEREQQAIEALRKIESQSKARQENLD